MSDPNEVLFQRLKEAEEQWRAALKALTESWTGQLEEYRAIAVKALDYRDGWVEEATRRRDVGRELLRECELHNAEYHHCTPAELLERARKVLQ